MKLARWTLTLASIVGLGSTLAAPAGSHRPTKKPELVWTCRSESDPDFTHVDIYWIKGDEYAARILQESGDGDEREIDIVGMRQVETEHISDELTRFVQVRGSFPYMTTNGEKPTRRTRNAVVDIYTALGESSKIKGIGPTGSEMNDPNLVCEDASVKRRRR